MKATIGFFAFALGVMLLIGLSLTVGGGNSTSAGSDPPPPAGFRATGSVRTNARVAAPPQIAEAYGKLPLSFELNQGQTDSRVIFLSRGGGYTLFLTGDEAVLALRSQKSEDGSQNGWGHWRVAIGERQVITAYGRIQFGSQEPEVGDQNLEPGIENSELFFPFTIQNSRFRIQKSIAPSPQSQVASAVRLKLVAADPDAKVIAVDKLPGKSNYFIGNDPRMWRTNVPNYARVKSESVYPGIDLVYYGDAAKGGQLEYDFVVAPGANPKAITMDVGADGVRPGEGEHLPAAGRPLPLRIEPNGDLVIPTDAGEVRFHKPVVYQPVEGVSDRRRPVGTRAPQHTTDHGPRTAGNQQSSIENRQFLDGRYKLTAKNQVSFEIPDYDSTRPLIIDPVLSYSTYLGGSGNDVGSAVAVDASGNAYVMGSTTSTNFPTAAPIEGSYHPSGQNCVNFRFGSPIVFPCPDAFVTKLNATGTAVLYSTYLGGSDFDTATGIAVESSGNAYLTGQTNSTDFPTATPVQASLGPGNCGVNPFTGAPNPCADAFVAKLNPAGDALVFSTYLGGSQQDGASGIALDSSASIYVTGATRSTDFPTTAGAFDTTCGTDGACNPDAFGALRDDAFVTKFEPSGLKLLYSTYLGGSSDDEATGIAVDSSGSAYVTGGTYSIDFPTTPGAYDTTCGTDGACNPNTVGQLQADAFVAKLDPTGSKLVYSTYLGGSGTDVGSAIGVDASGSAYVTGGTQSTDFPTKNPIQASGTDSQAGSSDAFVTKLNPAGSALVYSTYLDGSQGGGASGIAVDSSGDAYVTGGTSSGFPTVSPVQAASGSNGGGFVAKLDATGSALLYSTYFGGSSGAGGRAVAVDPSGNAFVTGSVASNFLVTPGSFMTSPGGGRCLGQSSVSLNPPCLDAFVVKVELTDAPGLAVAPASLNFGIQAVSTSATQTVNLLDAGSQPLTITSIALSGTNAGDFSETTTCPVSSSTLAGGTSCSVNVTFSPQTLGAKSATLVITNDAAGSPHSIPLAGVGAMPPTAVITPTSLAFGSVAVGSNSLPQTITLTNTGGAPLQISSANLAAGFQLQGASSGAVNCDIPPVTMNGGASCAYAVVFVPQAAGRVTGTLSFVDNAADSPQTVALSGTGVAPPDFSISASPTTTTVTAGGTATYTLTVSPAGGFNQTTVLTCSGAPLLARCVIAPSSVTPDGNNPATAMVSVTTTARSSLPPGTSPHILFPGPGLRITLTCLLALLSLGLLACARRRHAGLGRQAWTGVAAALLVAALSFGCGGGSSASSVQSGTPAGTYTLTVTGTPGSLTHTVNLTLTVN